MAPIHRLRRGGAAGDRRGGWRRAWIIDAVAVGLADMLARGAGPQAAVVLPRIGAQNGAAFLEKGSAVEPLASDRCGAGHAPRIVPVDTGMQALRVTPQGIEGGADPRRHGVARRSSGEVLGKA